MDESSASACLPAADPRIEAPPEADAPVIDVGVDPVRSMPKSAKCIWCGAAMRYECDTQAREIWGYCSPECKEDFLEELECDPEKAFNRSRRNKRKPKQAPAWLQKLRAAAPTTDDHAAPGGVNLADDLAEPE